MSEPARFAFGKNWNAFLATLDDERIAAAKRSLAKMLGKESLHALRFLDIGSGSGLFSLAARQLGAEVVSFDYDADSVACARQLKERYFPNDGQWQIMQGSVLDSSFLEKLGLFDIVYSWGVLHHTGAMWPALENAALRVNSHGTLFIAIYNDQGLRSRIWWHIKRFYNRTNAFLRFSLVLVLGVAMELITFISRAARLKDPFPFARWRTLKKERGMSPWHDLVDWVGGFPFEVASAKAIIDFYTQRGFTLVTLVDKGKGMGCCEYVLEKKR